LLIPKAEGRTDKIERVYMKKWVQKAIVQKVVSFLPFSQSINFFFQKYITKGVTLSDDYFSDRLTHARDHLKGFKQWSDRTIPMKSLELGTGWYPIVPVSFFLAGVEEIYTIDISSLTTKGRLKTTLEKIVEYNNSGQLGKYINIVPNRVGVIINLLDDYDKLSLAEMFERLKITYLIEDARKLSLPDDSVDLVTSNNTFEHIYPDVLVNILEEFRRVVKKQGGVMSHFIDMSDHFAHLDKTITIFNFLRYSDKEWKLIDNSLQPQSRSRIYDYRKIYFDLNIPVSDESFTEGNPDELNSITLADKYSDKPLTEIVKSHCHFISQMTDINDERRKF
jgi:hypothetical protein